MEGNQIPDHGLQDPAPFHSQPQSVQAPSGLAMGALHSELVPLQISAFAAPLAQGALPMIKTCLLYTSDAADDWLVV